MEKCVIFCAGEFDGLLRPIDPDTLILAADGGLRHAQAAGITPDAVLGDFDSLGYVPEDGQVFPMEKDDTDAMLAARLGLQRGCREFVIYGGLDGPRLDHTVANFQLLQFLADHGARGYLVGSRQLATVIKNGTLTFPGGMAGDVSVFCMGPDARGVTLRGLKYTMEDGTLSAGFPLGVSNCFTGAEARVAVRDGSLLILWQRQGGM